MAGKRQNGRSFPRGQKGNKVNRGLAWAWSTGSWKRGTTGAVAFWWDLRYPTVVWRPIPYAIAEEVPLLTGSTTTVSNRQFTVVACR